MTERLDPLHPIHTDKPDASAPPAGKSMGEVEAELSAGGFDGQFQALTEGRLRCLTCRSVFSVEGHRAQDTRRVEGASDPDDMAIIIPLVCPVCATPGTLTAHYGPGASEEEASVLQAFER